MSFQHTKQFLYTQGVLNDWNQLPSYVVEASSVNSFKNRLDDFLADMDNWKAIAYKVHEQQVTSIHRICVSVVSVLLRSSVTYFSSLFSAEPMTDGKSKYFNGRFAKRLIRYLPMTNGQGGGRSLLFHPALLNNGILALYRVSVLRNVGQLYSWCSQVLV